MKQSKAHKIAGEITDEARNFFAQVYVGAAMDYHHEVFKILKREYGEVEAENGT
jgi:hypothetical protein